MHCNWPQLTVQQMVNEAWLFTFCHWTHGCDVNVVKNYQCSNSGYFASHTQSEQGFGKKIETVVLSEEQLDFNPIQIPKGHTILRKTHTPPQRKKIGKIEGYLACFFSYFGSKLYLLRSHQHSVFRKIEKMLVCQAPFVVCGKPWIRHFVNCCRFSSYFNFPRKRLYRPLSKRRR